ncbi:hypothetical protein MGYG_09065 [Nannizzia gypsea CBS 118893]|uniref:Uncharacterized protein n=1 Tax=Arthroderma gypseum (strain ATCC MYA-4604 / CBS 118893) TaxID=535722 RepID=E4UWV8_ARTGP|nr:hypothetical protein MGYG_09065 [Nannizzia gypsea CBS 118893]EFR01811.1 hypothetical protein MGYG_09065 [Nannizzia gypsea CBS 118893]
MFTEYSLNLRPEATKKALLLEFPMRLVTTNWVKSNVCSLHEKEEEEAEEGKKQDDFRAGDCRFIKVHVSKPEATYATLLRRTAPGARAAYGTVDWFTKCCLETQRRATGCWVGSSVFALEGSINNQNWSSPSWGDRVSG